MLNKKQGCITAWIWIINTINNTKYSTLPTKFKHWSIFNWNLSKSTCNFLSNKKTIAKINYKCWRLCYKTINIQQWQHPYDNSLLNPVVSCGACFTQMTILYSTFYYVIEEVEFNFSHLTPSHFLSFYLSVVLVKMKRVCKKNVLMLEVKALLCLRQKRLRNVLRRIGNISHKQKNTLTTTIAYQKDNELLCSHLLENNTHSVNITWHLVWS